MGPPGAWGSSVAKMWVMGLGFRVQGLGFRVQGSGFRAVLVRSYRWVAAKVSCCATLRDSASCETLLLFTRRGSGGKGAVLPHTCLSLLRPEF